MKFLKSATVVATSTAAFAALPFGLAAADDGHGSHGRGERAPHAVFVQTVEDAGNHVIAFHRNDDGSLIESGRYATGGTGAFAAGAVVDPLASQSGLAYDREHNLLFAVNSKSDTVSVFTVRGERLVLRQTIASGGTFPSSVAIRDGVVEVLNAGGSGSIAAFRVRGDKLVAIDGSVRSLGLNNDVDAPNFLTAPGQVGFTADGRFVVVTTKANNTILTFRVRNGRAATTPVVTASPNAVPFAFDVDDAGHLVVVEAGTGAVTSYDVAGDGSLVKLSSKAGGQKAACWIFNADGRFYVANAGSATLSGFDVAEDGSVSLVGPTGVVAATAGGPVDLAFADHGDVLYVQEGGAHAVHAFARNDDGTLTSIGSVTGLPDMEGIVAI